LKWTGKNPFYIKGTCSEDNDTMGTGDELEVEPYNVNMSISFKNYK